MPGAKLVIRNGGFDGMEYAIQAEETLIGRNPTTDVTLLDENISREHALIVFDPEADVVHDRGSPEHERDQGERQGDPLASARARRRDPGRPHPIPVRPQLAREDSGTS